MPNSDDLETEALGLEDIEHAPTALDPRSLAQGSDDLQQKFEQTVARLGKTADELAESQEEVQRLKGKVSTHEKLDALIEPYSNSAFVFMSVYSAGVGIILLLHGFKLWGFQLPPDTLNYLVGSTAVTVIGLVGMVLTGVFIGARK